MKFIFFLSSRYPTHKAYGVTTGETARELREIGNKVIVVAPSHTDSILESDEYNNELRLITSSVLGFIRRYLSRGRILGALVFVITSITFTLKSIRLIRLENPDVLWVRDYWAALLLQKLIPDRKFVVEIHQSPSFANHFALAIVGKHRETALLAIQESLKMELIKRYPNAKVFLGSMGASTEFFNLGGKKLELFPMQISSELKVCFLGRMTSSGRDNGLFQLLDDWRIVPSDIASLTLIGLSPLEINEISSRYSLKNVTLAPSLKHSEVAKALADFDCGLVPYPEGHYHRVRFPIKIVEYCASALNIIATKTSSNQELLSDEISYFYTAGDAKGLLEALNSIKARRSESKRRAENGFLWAQDYTYNKRITEVYRFLEGQIT